MADVKTTDELYNDLINRQQNKAQKINQEGSLAEMSQMMSKQGKMDFSEISPYKRSDVYKTLNDGSEVAMFESFIPGTNNEERLALRQDAGDKWANGLTKFIGKTGTAVLGGTVGVVNGITEAFDKGGADAIYSNSFSSWLDDLNTKMDYKLPNYYTQQEKEYGFYDSLTKNTSNFLANDVLGGLSFTVGAVVSEGIWAGLTGGTSLASAGARWGTKALGFSKVAKGIEGFKSLLKSPLKNVFTATEVAKDVAITSGRIGAGLNAARFAVTSTGYEASVEAMHFKKEQEEMFYDNFKEKNGRMPTIEEENTFREKLADASNGVFALNTAILIPSNLAMFGQNVLKGLPSPFKSITKSANKTFFGIGAEKTAEGAFKALSPTKLQRIAKQAYIYGQSPITEGLYEEGMQSVASKFSGKWLESQYNPQAMQNTFSMANALGESMSEVYGTKEGWKEIGIGMIIGGGSSIVLGQGKSEMKELEQANEDYISYENTYQGMTLKQKGFMSSQIQTAIQKSESAQQRNDKVGAHLASNDALIAQMDYKMSVGESLNDLTQEYKTQLDSMSKEDFAEIGVEEDQIAEYKDTVLSAHKSVAQRYKKNRQYSDLLIGSSNIQDLDTNAKSRALAFALTQGENVNFLMDDIVSDMSKYLESSVTNALNIKKELETNHINLQNKISDAVADVNFKEKRAQDLEKRLRKVQARPKKLSDVKSGGTEVEQDEYFDIAEQILQAQEELSIANEHLSDLANQINIQTQRKAETESVDLSANLARQEITVADLKNLDKNLEKIDGIIESFRGVDEKSYKELEDLTKQYKNAKENFYGYQQMAMGLSSGKLEFKGSNTWIGKKLKKQTLNDFTIDFFKELGVYENKKAEALAKVTVEQLADKIEEDEYVKFKEEGVVSQERIEKIAEKLKNKELLNEREEEIYQANKEAFPNPNKPDLSPEAIIKRKIEKLTQEREGVSLQEQQKIDKQIAKLEKRLLPTTTANLTEVELIKQRIEEALRGRFYPIEAIGENYYDLKAKKPTQQDVDRYRELQGIKKRSKEESLEHQKLKQKLSDWRLVDSARESDNQSIADLVELVDILETQSDKQSTLDNLDDDSELLLTEDQLQSTSVFREDILQNVGGAAVMQVRDSNGIPTVFISHVKVGTIINRLQDSVTVKEIQTVNRIDKKGNIFLNPPKEYSNSFLSKHEKIEGTTFTIGETKIVIGKGGTIAIPLEQWRNIREEVGFDGVKTDEKGSWSFDDIYEVLPDGSRRKKESEFKTNVISEEIYEVEEGDYVEAFVDYKTDWNIGLINDAVEELSSNSGEISQETIDKMYKTLEISVRNNNAPISTMKQTSDTVINQIPLEVRRRFAENFIAEINNNGAITGYPKEINLGIELKVKELFLGTPDLIVKDGKYQEIELTDRALEKVVSQGYVQGDTVVLADKSLESKVTRQFVENLVEKNPNSKIPIVVFKKGKHLIVYPISMTKTNSPKDSMIDDILKTNDSEIDKIKDINRLLLELGISPSKYNLVALEQEKLDSIKEELSKYQNFISADELASVNYDKVSLKSDVKIKIDLENRGISSPKLFVDYSSTILPMIETVQTTMIELRKDITNELLKIQKEIQASSYLSDKNRFIEAFDETEIDDSKSDIMNRKNVNFLKSLLFEEKEGRLVNKPVSGDAIKLLTRERIEKLRGQLNKIILIESQAKVKKDSQFKKTQDQSLCNS